MTRAEVVKATPRAVPDDARLLVKLAAASPSCLSLADTRVHGGDYMLTDLHRFFDDRSLELASGKASYDLFSCPPQHGKSRHFGINLPAWWIGRWPNERVLYTSYSDDWACVQGESARELLRRTGPDVFGVRIRPSVSAASRWRVDKWVGGARRWAQAAGGMDSAGIGGQITGKGANLIIWDDLLKNDEEAMSALVKDKRWTNLQITVASRLRYTGHAPGAVVGIATRWAEDDPHGHLLEQQKQGKLPALRYFNLPALCDVDDDHLARPRDAALCPELYSQPVLEAKRQALDAYWWNSVYQGRPNPEGGGVFRAEWFRYFRWVGGKVEHDGRSFDPLTQAIRFATVDLAGAKPTEARDFTVIQVWASWQGCIYLLDVVRGRYDGPTTRDHLHRLRAQWKLHAVHVEEVQWRLDFMQQSIRENLPILSLIADKSKGARALGATPYIRNGKVWFPDSMPWLEPLKGELTAFKLDESHKNDDQADCLVYACRVGFGAESLPMVGNRVERKGADGRDALWGMS